MEEETAADYWRRVMGDSSDDSEAFEGLEEADLVKIDAENESDLDFDMSAFIGNIKVMIQKTMRCPSLLQVILSELLSIFQKKTLKSLDFFLHLFKLKNELILVQFKRTICYLIKKKHNKEFLIRVLILYIDLLKMHTSKKGGVASLC